MGNRSGTLAAAAADGDDELPACRDLDDAYDPLAYVDADRAVEEACPFRWRSADNSHDGTPPLSLSTGGARQIADFIAGCGDGVVLRDDVSGAAELVAVDDWEGSEIRATATDVKKSAGSGDDGGDGAGGDKCWTHISDFDPAAATLRGTAPEHTLKTLRLWNAPPAGFPVPCVMARGLTIAYEIVIDADYDRSEVWLALVALSSRADEVRAHLWASVPIGEDASSHKRQKRVAATVTLTHDLAATVDALGNVMGLGSRVAAETFHCCAPHHVAAILEDKRVAILNLSAVDALAAIAAPSFSGWTVYESVEAAHAAVPAIGLPMRLPHALLTPVDWRFADRKAAAGMPEADYAGAAVGAAALWFEASGTGLVEWGDWDGANFRVSALAPQLAEPPLSVVAGASSSGERGRRTAEKDEKEERENVGEAATAAVTDRNIERCDVKISESSSSSHTLGRRHGLATIDFHQRLSLTTVDERSRILSHRFLPPPTVAIAAAATAASELSPPPPTIDGVAAGFVPAGRASATVQACSGCRNTSERESCFRCRGEGKLDLGCAYTSTHVISADGSLRAATPDETRYCFQEARFLPLSGGLFTQACAVTDTPGLLSPRLQLFGRGDSGDSDSGDSGGRTDIPDASATVRLVSTYALHPSVDRLRICATLPNDDLVCRLHTRAPFDGRGGELTVVLRPSTGRVRFLRHAELAVDTAESHVWLPPCAHVTADRRVRVSAALDRGASASAVPPPLIDLVCAYATPVVG